MLGRAVMLDELTELVGQADLVRAIRRAMVCALVLGVAGLLGAVLLSHALVGLGICIGFAAGIVNLRLIGSAVAHVAEQNHAKPARPLAGRTAIRLALVSAVAIGLLIVAAPVGVGMLGGLIVFQFIFLANLAWAVFRQGVFR